MAPPPFVVGVPINGQGGRNETGTTHQAVAATAGVSLSILPSTSVTVRPTCSDIRASWVGMLKTQSLLTHTDSQHRQATPAEQASVILFLLSDEASNITGAAWATDGGWTAY